MERFEAPLGEVAVQDFTNADLVYQIGIEPNRIDIIMDAAGVEFEKAWRRRERSTYGTVPINLIAREDLIKAKQAAGRPQDLLDLERL